MGSLDIPFKQKCEAAILKDYQYLRDKTKADIERVDKEVSDTLSNVSGFMSKA